MKESGIRNQESGIRNQGPGGGIRNRGRYFFSTGGSGLGGSSLSPSLRPFLNSPMPCPMPRMICGIFVEPKSRSTITRMMTSSEKPMPPRMPARMDVIRYSLRCSLRLLRHRYNVSPARMIPDLEPVHVGAGRGEEGLAVVPGPVGREGRARVREAKLDLRPRA